MRKVKIFSVFMSIILLCSTLLPSVSVSAAFTPKFALHSEGVYMVNLDTDIVIVSKNADKKLTPASTTKIMTALVALENIKDFNAKVVVNSTATDEFWSGTLIGPSTMFRKGDNGRIHYPGRSAAYCSSTLAGGKPLPMYDWKAGDATGEGTYYERKMTTAYGMRCVKE